MNKAAQSPPKRKNKPGQGRKPEGRVRAAILILPVALAALDALPGPARGRKVEALLWDRAAN